MEKWADDIIFLMILIIHCHWDKKPSMNSPDLAIYDTMFRAFILENTPLLQVRCLLPLDLRLIWCCQCHQIFIGLYGHEAKQWGFLISEVKNKKRLMIAPICSGYVCLKRWNSGRQDAIVHAGLSADFPLWANLSAGSSVVLTLLRWTKKRLAR